jgi:hypothetical protein
LLLLESRLRQVEHDALLGIVSLHGDAGTAGTLRRGGDLDDAVIAIGHFVTVVRAIAGA